MIHLQEEQVEILAYQTAKEGKKKCGDAYFLKATDEYVICVIADGLGSGEFANESAEAVVTVVNERHHEDVDSLMRHCNNKLVHKRGAAVSIIKVFFHTRDFVYSCVGNIRFFLYSPSGKLTYPLPVTGYLSGKPQKFRTQRFPYEKNSKFMFHSDGLHINGVKSQLTAYSPLKEIANTIIKQQERRSDDTTFMIGHLN